MWVEEFPFFSSSEEEDKNSFDLNAKIIKICLLQMPWQIIT